MRNLFLATLCMLLFSVSYTQVVTYPYPVNYFPVTIELKPYKMAYMDVKPTKHNGKTVVLFHGKNFNGYYWKNVIGFLSDAGYRVIVPDQVGWGKSDHPDIHYSFHLLAYNSKLLLDSLGVSKCVIYGHSMGGMLATRFSLLYPTITEKLVLENPIGLEDYKTFVPYKLLTAQYETEKSATYESYKKYQQSYYPVWKPDYEQYVQAQAADLQSSNFEAIAWSNALTYQMIYEQPVMYEFSRLKLPTLLLIGQADRTVVGKNNLTEEQKKIYGNYPQLGKKLKVMIAGSKLIEIPGVGHIPHVQTPGIVKKEVLSFLGK